MAWRGDCEGNRTPRGSRTGSRPSQLGLVPANLNANALSARLTLAPWCLLPDPQPLMPMAAISPTGRIGELLHLGTAPWLVECQRMRFRSAMPLRDAAAPPGEPAYRMLVLPLTCRPPVSRWPTPPVL
jgi:hypothetical protein